MCVQTELLSDKRFSKLFTDADFEIDKTSEDYLLKHPQARFSAEVAQKAARKYVDTMFDEEKDGDDFTKDERYFH